MTSSEYIGIIKQLDCVICQHKIGTRISPCDAHHVGTGADRSDWAIVPLCKEHHQGSTGVHGLHRRAFYDLWHTSEVLMLAWTAMAVMKRLRP